VLYCVLKLCTVVSTISWAVLTVLWIGFCHTGPISLCVDTLILCLLLLLLCTNIIKGHRILGLQEHFTIRRTCSESNMIQRMSKAEENCETQSGPKHHENIWFETPTEDSFYVCILCYALQYSISHMAVHHLHLVHYHRLHHLLLAQNFTLNSRLGSSANPFLHRPFPFLPDWLHGLSDHAQRLYG